MAQGPIALSARLSMCWAIWASVPTTLALTMVTWPFD